MSSAEIIAELPRLSAAELAQVQAKLSELVPAHNNDLPSGEVSNHPAIGVWKSRADLPDDSAEASDVLRKHLMQRTPPDEKSR